MHIILNGKNDNWNYIGKWWLKIVPRVRTKTYSDKRFDKTASTFWNNLPSETQNEQSLEIFKKNVKTYLFRIAGII
jgi:hypothetical protein